MKYLKKFVETSVSEHLQYHIDNNMSVTENIFRYGSDSYFKLLKECRELYDVGSIELSGQDKELFESSDIGKFEMFEGELVPLDLPLEIIEKINEAEYKGRKVKLNYPTRSSGPKKYKVYVKNPKTGKVKIVHFGDVSGGLSAKVSDPKARKSFVARHKCDRTWKPSDKLTASYWSCRLTKFGHLFGGRTYSGYW
jgi:hypothetical protein